MDGSFHATPKLGVIFDKRMGTYNEIHYMLQCPRCHKESRQYIQLHFGDTSIFTLLKIGDKYPWVKDKAVQNGGRPEIGDFEGSGYVECDKCKKDFFVIAVVRNDILKNIVVDESNEPYIV